MRFQPYQSVLLFLFITLLTACTSNNVPLGPNVDQAALLGDRTIEIEVARDGVFAGPPDQSQPLPLAQFVEIAVGDRVAVDNNGRAILHVGTFLTLEMLQAGSVEVQQFLLDEQGAALALAQRDGVIIVDLAAASDRQDRVIIQTPYAAITAGGNTRFAVVHEQNNPLIWVLALAADQNGLLVSTGAVNQTLVGGQALWLTPLGEPGPLLTIGRNVEAWLEAARNSTPNTELSEILLPPANMRLGPSTLTTLPAPAQPVELSRDSLGAVDLTLDSQGIYGSPTYRLEDCDSDGNLDILIQNGIIRFDFQSIQARVQGLDITLLNRDQPGQGAIRALDLVGDEVVRRQLTAASGSVQTLSLRSAQQRYLTAEVIVSQACFLGLSLTPPDAPADTGDAIPVAETLPSTTSADAVVNVLETSVERLPENGDFRALRVGGGNNAGVIEIDGAQSDWDTLAENGGSWSLFSAITHNDGCANRYPGAEALTDLSGQVQFAYNEQNLYVAFVVNDDGLVTYSGADERYFLGDSPQLLLDIDLNGDFDQTDLNVDDIQIDFIPRLDQPAAALWQLNILTSRSLAEARVLVTPTDTGYFLEAALPWASLNRVAQPGDRFGVVASVSDNDTPDTNAQECIISTSPQRNWRNPATWGTVLLIPDQP